jgi:hypothetical protein
MQSSLIDLYSVYGGSFNDRTSTCNDHAAFSSGCGPYLVRMIHGKKARPIQKDGTLQRFLLGGLGPAPTAGRPWGDPPGASACNDHAAFASGCGPYLVRMIHGARARPIQKDGTLQRFLLGGLGPAPTVGQPWGDSPLKPAWFASESARACCPMYLPRRGPVCSVVADSRAR